MRSALFLHPHIKNEENRDSETNASTNRQSWWVSSPTCPGPLTPNICPHSFPLSAVLSPALHLLLPTPNAHSYALKAMFSRHDLQNHK